jgi:predicted transcriptional regulator
MAKTPTSVRLSEEQSDALAKIAERDERTQSWLISKAIDEYIERQLGKGRSTNN